MAYIRYRFGKYHVEIKRKGMIPIYESFFKKSDAKKFCLQKELEIQQKKYRDTSMASKTLLKDLIKEEIARIGKKHRDFYKYRKMMRYSVVNQSLLDLKASNFVDYRNKRLGEGVQGSTINRELSLFSIMIKKSVLEKNIYIPDFPINQFVRAKENPPKERRLYEGELEKILELTDRFSNDYIKPAILFSIETGMRLSEQVNLKWKDISIESKTAYLSALDTKTKTSRTIPLSSKAVETLRELPIDIKGKVFPISKSYLSHSFTRICKELDLKDLTWHCLRREAVSRLLERGLNITEVMRVSGHKTLKALQIYVKHNVSDIARKLA